MLTNCPECNSQVSDKAVSCPHCGFPLKYPPSGCSKPHAKRKHCRLPNGFGQISKIKGRNLRNPYRAMVTVGKTDVGRPICKPLKPKSYFATYNEAYTALMEYNKNPYDLEFSITVQQLYDKWSEEYFKTSGDSTIRAVKSAWSYCSAVANIPARDIRVRHIKDCMEHGTAVIHGATRSPSAATQSRIKAIFNLMLDYALEYEIVERNYARNFSLPSATAKEMSVTKQEHISFTDEEISLLWSHVNDTYGVDILLIQCYSGWRPQELGLIRLADVDLEKGSFRGGIKTKAGIDRIVPIHSRIRQIVERKYHEAEKIGSEFLLNWDGPKRRNTNRNLTYIRYKQRFFEIRDELNLNPDHRPHDGRKHFVTMAKRFGVDEYAIKYIVGHAISDITEKVYTDRDFEWLKQEMEKIK